MVALPPELPEAAPGVLRLMTRGFVETSDFGMSARAPISSSSRSKNEGICEQRRGAARPNVCVNDSRSVNLSSLESSEPWPER
jgi:hypothetical protein